ncbi:hypothetical protein CRG98_041683 [Punica granatum]|uniref:Uncharacterized protein n=1 Tax=Punica granatum TaxID=22663 RepID=A0A2I0I1R7_PUNGR|nr:hypothetical protein CRG98_041683 [Punica granatum]
MSFLTGPTEDSYKPVVNGDTTAASYWFNWRVLLCALWILASAAFSLFLIWKHEGRRGSNSHRTREGPSSQEEEPAGFLYDDEMWSPCLKGVHPGWLLAFRVVAFFVLSVMLIITSFVDGASIFYYYTQWTFTFITIYFGLGSLLSSYGCYEYHRRLVGDKVENMEIDSEHGTYIANGPLSSNKKPIPREGRKPADIWGYLFQITFQMNAGAVVLTDCVFWFIIVPFLAINNYNLSVRFPLFRIGYFFMWTVIYVIFQWILHACVSIWWPYPFLDLSSPFAPLWYLLLKHFLLSRWFPQSYQCVR